MNQALETYAYHGNQQVDGWLTPLAIEVLLRVAKEQERSSVTGPSCEIGVHHGRLFILLHLLTSGAERSVGWDLFERQEENVGGSGHGDYDVLLKNLGQHNCDLERIDLLTSNSMDLTGQGIVQTCGGHPRLFSIDGGHTAEVTQNDLTLASSSICSSGVVILDDFFNEAWPGVAEGGFRFFARHPDALVPFAVAGNKFLFTNSESAAASYVVAIGKLAGQRVGPDQRCSVTSTEFLGHPLLVLGSYPNTVRNTVGGSRAWQAIRETPFGRFIRSCVRAVSR